MESNNEVGKVVGRMAGKVGAGDGCSLNDERRTESPPLAVSAADPSAIATLQLPLSFRYQFRLKLAEDMNGHLDKFSVQMPSFFVSHARDPQTRPIAATLPPQIV